jgi:hypothetical protein
MFRAFWLLSSFLAVGFVSLFHAGPVRTQPIFLFREPESDWPKILGFAPVSVIFLRSRQMLLQHWRALRQVVILVSGSIPRGCPAGCRS